ncbi:MAG: MBL fold metallo-hydrolase [Rudaea sp.]
MQATCAPTLRVLSSPRSKKGFVLGYSLQIEGMDMIETKAAEYELQPSPPAWETLGNILGVTDPVFQKILVLRGFDFSSNTYVIQGDRLAIVDPGNDYTGFMGLWQLGFKPEDIDKVVLTHGHPDHAMGVIELLRSYPNIREHGGFELLVHAAGPRQLKGLVRESGCRLTELEGGETLELGGLEWLVINTPGHTVDGICLYHPDTKTAITGDTALPDAMAEIDESAGGRLDHYLFSLRALLSRDIQNVLPGHGAPVALFGRQVLEGTYEGLMMKIIGAEGETPWITGATELAEKGLFPEAIYCCDKELAIHPEAVKALKLKALCLNDLGRFEEAFEAFGRLDELEQPSQDAFLKLMGKGYALMGLGKHEASVSHFDRALELRPGVKDALIYKGMALYLSGRMDEAMEIECFRGEFVERFKDELVRKKSGG